MKVNKDENLEIFDTGSIVIKGKYILDIIRKLDSDFINLEIVDDHKILIYTENSEFNLNGIDSQEDMSKKPISADWHGDCLPVEECKKLGVNVVLSDVWAKGGEGGVDLANEVVKLCEKDNDFTFSYDLDTTIEEKIEAVVKKVYGGVGVSILPAAQKQIDKLAELGFDMIHPWQESAGMSYDTYLEKYADQFAILGGVCVQTSLGLVSQERLEADIRRVFGLLKGKRWIACTTHFVQSHCTMEDLSFAFDLIYRLARE